MLDLDDPTYYLNRELGQVAFNARVLEEADDPNNPLLERVKFLAITESNTDELFMVRVAGLKQQVEAGVLSESPDGLSPAEQLAAVRKASYKLLKAARVTWQELKPALAQAGVIVLDHAELNDKQRASAESSFDELIFPVLTPLAFDPSRPFPHISNLSLNLAVVVRDSAGELRFARLKVPASLPRLVPLKRSSGSVRRDGTVPHNHYFVWLEQLIAAHLDRLFPGMEIVESHAFRVTRDADNAIQDLEADDLLETIEQSVRERRFANLVRLEVDATMSDEILELLVTELEMDPLDIYALDAPLGLSDLMGLYGVDRHDLKDPPFVPFVPPSMELTGARMFELLRRQDSLLHHPYDAFAPVVGFLRSAAADPDVLAIKQTLYRVGRNSPVVGALLDAREQGKQVAVVVELKARFDEESNIEWARRLEAEGVHVIYGLLGLKTHAKMALVVRKEGESIRRYVHLGTGNYNHATAGLYTDLGLFTCDPDIGADASELFNHLTGYSAAHRFRKLLVAPINLRSRFEAMIRREIEHSQAGRPAHLIFKCNSLVDPGVIALLYAASRAGVRIDLVIRGICCLRPGVPGLSDTIRVISIVGRFLEHSRIFYFENGGQPQAYVGSADLMPRNIDRRVEVLFPVEDPTLIARLRNELLDVALADTAKARELRYNGSYVRVQPAAGSEPFNSQEWFMRNRNAAARRHTASRYRL
ncbi:MAG: polyphosphate kinase 1 [Caldilineae bacterium]|nr:polyphosphate kinase 1 [Chloroflexota bacterium]MCB9177695.1 polyphosphate kinase 1 [Caldilineae bacterium]